MRHPAPSKIAIVDDDAAVRDALSFLMDVIDQPHELFASAEDFLSCQPAGFAGLITDFHMPLTTGLQLVHKLGERAISLPVMLMSGDLTDEMVDAGRSAGIGYFSEKPLSLEGLTRFLAATR